MKFYPPQLEILQGLNLPKNVFSFKVANASNNIIPVRLFGSIADLTRISTNSISVSSENVVIPELSDTTIEYSLYEDEDAKIQQYAIDVHDYILNLNTADGLTSNIGDVEITSNDLANFIRNNQDKFPVSAKFLKDMITNTTKNVKVISNETPTTMITGINVGNTPAMQMGVNPFIIDGNFAANLSAISMTTGKTIADLWSYVLSNDLHLKALMIVADDADAPLSNIEVEEINPFFTPDNEILSLSKYQNPYVVNKYAGLATDIDILVDKNRYFDINIYPQNTMFHLFFE